MSAQQAQNSAVARNGRVCAICCCCGRRSRPVDPDDDGEPDLWSMPRGWSTAPYPARFQHTDGSTGSTFHCPTCNGLLRKGATLQTRAYLRNTAVVVALSALAACGGGGGGGGGGFAPIAAAPAEAPAAAPVVQAAPSVKPTAPPSNLLNPNCVTGPDGLLVTCELAPSPWPIGVTVPASGFVTFTNRTGGYLQVNSIEAFTGEVNHWGEFCAALNFGSNRQDVAGTGEVACTTKAENQNYIPLTFGQGTGLLVEPGGVVILGAKPAMVSHTYALNVAPNTTGVQVWRAPAVDEVIPCNGLPQYTAWNPWKNDTGYTKHVSGALIYNESGSANRAELSGHACLYVLNPDGTPRVSQCDDSLRTRGAATFSGIEVHPGESVVAQAVNTCSAPGEWDWAAYLQVW